MNEPIKKKVSQLRYGDVCWFQNRELKIDFTLFVVILDPIAIDDNKYEVMVKKFIYDGWVSGIFVNGRLCETLDILTHDGDMEVTSIYTMDTELLDYWKTKQKQS